MKKFTQFILPLIFISLTSNFLFAQTSENKASVFKKMDIQLSVGAFWSHVDPDPKIAPEQHNVFSSYDQWGPQFMVHIELNDRLSFGLGYKRSSNFIQMDTTSISPRSLNNRWNYINYEFKDWEIPLRVRYIFSKKSIRPFLDASISLNGLSQFRQFGFYFDRSNPSGGNEFTQLGAPENNASYDIGGGLYIDIVKNVAIVLDARYQLAEFFWISKGPIQLTRMQIGLGLNWNLYEKNWQN